MSEPSSQLYASRALN